MAQDEADTASIATTVSEEESDKDWEVDYIVGDAVVDGQKLWLVRWTDFALYRATWEPTEHVNDTLIEEWKRLKRKIKDEKGGSQKYVQDWIKAARTVYEERWHRHLDRNKRRRRLGISRKCTTWQLPDEYMKELEETYLPAWKGPSKDDPIHVVDSTSEEEPDDASQGFLSAQKNVPEGRALFGKGTLTFKNVFATDKAQKPRDPTTRAAQRQGAKLLNYRGQNLLRKKSRDKENAAPPTLPKILRSLNQDDPLPHRSAQPTTSDCRDDGMSIEPGLQDPRNGTESTQIDLTLGRSSSSAITTTDSQPSPSRGTMTATTETHAPRRSPTKKKKVRFDKSQKDSISAKQSPEDEEPSLFVQDQESGLAPPVHNLSKTCSLGSDAHSLIMVFHGFPQTEAYQRLNQKQRLTFSHACHASDFITQCMSLPQRASGSVSAPADSEVLDTITDRLRAQCKGLFCHTESFSIILFPSKSEDWAEAKADWRDVSEGEGPLTFILLDSGYFSHDQLPSETLQNLEAEAKKTLGGNLKKFLQLEPAEKIYPSAGLKSKSGERHHTFLAYPPSSIEQAKLMSQWIEASCQSACVVFDGDDTVGEWNKFVDHGSGALIIHEDAWKKLRLFPRMHLVLKRVSQGQIALCLLDRALASSVSSGMWFMKRQTPGNMGLRRLASSGTVVLLTPSFIVSETRACHSFLRWFQQITMQTARQRVKLAVSSDIIDWMEDLILDRIERREWASTVVERIESCIEILTDVFRDCPSDDELGSTDILSPVVFAPRMIDASDEQSLVNWFGWWSAHGLDKYCLFYVLGSSLPESAKDTNVHLRPISWAKDTVNDPDEALQILSGSANRQPATASKGCQPGPLKLVASDRSQMLQQKLSELERGLQGYGKRVFFHFKPISYENVKMQHDYGDLLYDRGFETYEGWFKHFREFSQLHKSSRSMKHTLSGFFYTPEFNNGEAPNTRHAPQRHSWIAMFRPCNSESFPWEGSELLIWDQRYRGQMDLGRDLYEADLLPEHRTFIASIGQANDRKNPDHCLRKVWVGGWGRWESPYTNPLDITIDRISLFASDFSRWVPPHEADLPERGWGLVKPECDRPQPMDIDATDDSQLTKDANRLKEDEWDPDARIIFHPPRGQPVDTVEGGVWRNRLFKETRYAKPNPSDGRILYKFVGTKSWYGQQVRAGRGFEHILVDRWQTIFKELNISTN